MSDSTFDKNIVNEDFEIKFDNMEWEKESKIITHIKMSRVKV